MTSRWETLRTLSSPEPAARFATTEKGRAVATAEPPQAAQQTSLFGNIANKFREIVPQGVRDTVGNALQVATSGEAAVNALSGGHGGTEFRNWLERAPVVGGALGAGFDIGLAPTTLLTAGYGGAAGAALKGAGLAGKIAAAALSPAIQSDKFAVRLLSEIAMGTAATEAGDYAMQKTDNPLVALGAGVLGGLGAGLGAGIVQNAGRSAARVAERAALAPAAHGRKYVGELADFNDVLAEMNPVTEGSVGGSAIGRAANNVIDPSRNLGPLGQGRLALARQGERADQFTETALKTAIDSHAIGTAPAIGPGGVFDVDLVTGKLKNVPGNPDVADFLESRKNVNLEGLSPEQQNLMRDIHTYIDENTAFRVAHGLPVSKNPDKDLALILRQVEGIRGVTDVGRTNSSLGRVFEERAKGIESGIDYSHDIRAALGLQLQTSYREAAEKQFEAFIDPLAKSAKSIVLAKNAGMMGRGRAIFEELKGARQAAVGERRTVMNEAADVRRTQVRALRELGTARQRLGSAVGEIRGRNAQANVTNADAGLTALYQAHQQADDATKALQNVLRSSSADEAAFNSARQELLQANRNLSTALGEIAERGQAKGIAADTGERLLTATKSQQRRVTVAQTRLDNAKKLVEDTKPGTGARRDAERTLRRAEAATARVEGEMAAETKASARASKMPLSLGKTMAKAQAEVTQINEALAELENFRKMLPNVRDVHGPAVTQSGKDAVATAKSKMQGWQKEYSAALRREQSSSVQPGYVFGNSNEKDIPVARWKGKFLPNDSDYQKLAETMDVITGRPIANKPNPLTATVQEATNFLRLTSASGDAAAPFIQLLPLLGANPKVWAKAVYAQYKGMSDPQYLARYLSVPENRLAAQEMASVGAGLNLSEQFSGLHERGGRLTQGVQKFGASRVGRETLGRLESGMDSALITGRIEHWKAMRGAWDGSLADLGTLSRDLTGSLSSKALGVGAGQRALESTFLAFSPRMLRSTIALISHAANPNDPIGREAARSLLGMAAAMTSMAVAANIGIGAAKGESQKQIEQRLQDTLDPTSGKFLNVDIGGQRVGVGGQVRAITQFIAKAAANPAGFATADALDNPLINFYMGRGSVGASVATTLAEGITEGGANTVPYASIDNVPDALLHIGTSMFPFVVQAQEEMAGASAIARVSAGLLGFGGLNVNQKSPTDNINDEAMARYQKPYAEATGQQQQELEAARPDLFVLKQQRAAEFGSKDEKEKAVKIRKADSDRIQSERALVDALQRDKISPSQFKDEMKNIQRDASVVKRALRGDEANYATADENKQALTAWYDTFDAAKIPGTEIVDWDTHDKMEAELMARLTPEQRTYIEERRKSQHAPEAQYFFDNEKTVQDAGYYATMDDAFERIRGSIPGDIESYSDLALKVAAAKQSGDRATDISLSRIKARIDRLADAAKERLRRNNKALDTALVENGRVSKPIR